MRQHSVESSEMQDIDQSQSQSQSQAKDQAISKQHQTGKAKRKSRALNNRGGKQGTSGSVSYGRSSLNEYKPLCVISRCMRGSFLLVLSYNNDQVWYYFRVLK